MTIIELLQSSDYQARITVGHRWMVYDKTTRCWVIYERLPYQKKTRVIQETFDENNAVYYLKGK